MKHAKLLIIKWIATFVLLYLVLGLGYGIGLGSIFTISLLSIFTYYVGDVLIFQRTNNFFATVTDFIVNYVAIYLLLNVIGFRGDALIASFFSTTLITIYELFFHLYVAEHFSLTDYDRIDLHRYDYMTEISEELEFDDLDDFDDDEDYD